MSLNPASSYGADVRCTTDADELWSSCEGIAVVYQAALHRITTDSVIGPGGDGWGYDARRLLGLPASDLPGYQPILAEVLTRDPRIDSAEVTLTPVLQLGAMVDVLLSAECTTALGPFSLVMPVSQLTSAIIEGQG
jgi:hypothetical protein